MNVVGIIPSRYDSVRFPGKPLAMIDGKSLLQRVYEQVVQSKMLAETYIITDCESIYNHASTFTKHILLSKLHHESGTSRCFEAFQYINTDDKYDGFINIQGDEPLISSELIDEIARNLLPNIITTAVSVCDSAEDFINPNIVKVVCKSNGEALYFSRSPIPYNAESFYKHIGIYGFHSSIIQDINLTKSKYLLSENLEQLEWMYNGLTINTIITSHDSYGVDTPQDVDKILQMLNV